MVGLKFWFQRAGKIENWMWNSLRERAWSDVLISVLVTEVKLKGMVEWTGERNIVKRFEMSSSYSVFSLNSLHFPCSSHLFPKCNTWLFQSSGQDTPFPGKFSFLETLLKPSPTPAKKIPPPQRNLWLYNYLLYPFLHMIYVFVYSVFIQFCLFKGLFTQVVVSPVRPWVHGG